MSSITASPAVLVANTPNTTVTLTGSGTNFSLASTTQFMLVGGTGAAIISQSASSATTATLIIAPGLAPASLLLVDTTDGDSTTTLTVYQVGVSVAPATGTVQTTGTLDLTATLTNTFTGTTSVTWTVIPSSAGTCTPATTASGVATTFTPIGIASGSAVVVATSVLDPTQTASALLTISSVFQPLTGPGYAFPMLNLAQIFSGFWGGWVIPQYGQSAIWLQRINDDMPGALPTAAWDPLRGQTQGFTDGSFGVGWQLNGRLGYMAPVTVRVAKNDFYKTEEIVDSALVIYQGPVVLYQPPLALRKGDVLVFQDGRYVVGDRIEPAQVMGTTIISGAKLEARSTEDITQQIPLT